MTFNFVQLCDTQLVNGETTSKNFDERPLGFRLWHIGEVGPFQHHLVPLEGGYGSGNELVSD